MSIKLHYLCHLDKISENFGHTSSEQGERFHQDTNSIEQKVLRQMDVDSGFCWGSNTEENHSNRNSWEIKHKRRCYLSVEI